MSSIVEISRRAELDLAVQFRWYSDNAGTEIAEKFLRAFDSTVARLVVHSQLGRLRRFRAPELAEIRSFSLAGPFGSHLVFYRTTSSKLSIERIMHGARDLPQRLLEPPAS